MNNAKMKRKGMPSKAKIVEHWIPLLVNEEYDLDYYYDEVLNENNQLKTGIKKANDNCIMCFACTVVSATQRAHIVPVCEGGTNNVSNLHLLCSACHYESEGIETIESYNFWFSHKNLSNSAIHLERQRLVPIYAEEFFKGNHSVIPSFILARMKKIHMDYKVTQSS